jgi:predicted sulfurtransferase
MDRYLEFILNHYILSLALAVVIFLLIQEFFDTAFKRFDSISPMLAVQKIDNENTVVIDVREAPDFIQGHIENALNVPLSKLTEQLSSNNTKKICY